MLWCGTKQANLADEVVGSILTKCLILLALGPTKIILEEGYGLIPVYLLLFLG